MKRILAVLIILGTAVRVAFPLAGEWGSLSVNLDVDFYSNLIEGATSQTFLREGSYNTNTLGMQYYKSLGGMSLESGLLARMTNDSQVDVNSFSLNNWYIKLGADTGALGYDVTAGNSYADFSKLSFSQSLNGILGTLRIKNLTIKPLFGRQYDAKDNTNYQRNSYGVRAEQNINRKVIVGVNYITSEDDPASVTNDTSITAREKNAVTSVDFNAFVSRVLNVTGEVASSTYEEFKATNTEAGTAYNLGVRYNMRPFTLFTEYELADSSFNALGGMATKDRQRTSMRVGYALARIADLDVSVETMNDNLNKALSYTTTLNSQRINANVRSIENANLMISLSSRLSKSDDAVSTVDRTVTGYGGSFNYRFARITAGINADFNNNVDNKAATSYDTSYYGIFLNGNYPLMEKKAVLMPLVAYNTNESVQNTGARDSTTNLSVGARMTYTQKWEFYLRNAASSAVRGTAGTSSNRSMLNIQAKYNISGNSSRAVVVDYSSMQYTDADPSNNYTETTLRTKLQYRF